MEGGGGVFDSDQIHSKQRLSVIAKQSKCLTMELLLSKYVLSLLYNSEARSPVLSVTSTVLCAQSSFILFFFGRERRYREGSHSTVGD